ncbi:MAG TPA: LuxR C-terminal-related transcriptional regulator [Polyangiaceae bacterium]
MPASSGRGFDPVSLVEAAYELDGDEDAWLAQVRNAASAFMPQGNIRAAISFVYRAQRSTSFSVERANAVGMDAAAATAGLTSDAARDPDYVARTLFAHSCEFVSAVPGWEQQEGWQAVRAAYGATDGFVVNGLDTAGLGVVTLVLVGKKSGAPPRRREMVSRVAAHTVAALRIRRRLHSATERVRDAEAVLTPDGQIAHAVGDARLAESRESLRRAARALDRARGKLRRENAERAVAEWKVLVDDRWSLLDHFEHDGKRFLLACGNASAAPPGDLLTPRERQVVLLASRGHSNKLIAYELGIATSTVGVLLGRAAVRLGVRSRKALLERFERGTDAG